ncbi:hypothetical protein BAUCODRAFT_182018 [Baudoinia panamericana UAMH 10762]|uniref:NmrA-like domain-containing protein n=1 Tax=Baudoinia panamericana (strain UAMH 10762) TaxID=717646 RepID=M2NNE2_BAUPA|nr:uncharacterized protein BAUCODRAFT_182018 [Baudoinia panamericana UAMH 10762]EMD00756.1 hypothetical protein BAUCODRAFT_182018 [Baudoinia panamericana UAMH 10762]
MSSKKLLTIFGASGNQGGSVIDFVLSSGSLQAKYALRGITRDPSSSKSQALASKGVDMVKADMNDIDSLKTAIRGSYGVFGVTDFWAVLSKEIEVRQGKNIFDAVKAEGVKHYIWSSLPWTAKVSNGKYTHIDHFDGKAEVEEYVEKGKGDMIASYFMPAINGTPMLNMPFPDSIAWPLMDPRRDSGKYIMGLFEGGDAANGVEVQAVSFWTTPKEVVAAYSKASGRDVVFNTIPGEMFASYLPENIRDELTEMVEYIGEYSYYGKGTEKEQDKHDKWIVPGVVEKVSMEEWAQENGPFKW